MSLVLYCCWLTVSCHRCVYLVKHDPIALRVRRDASPARQLPLRPTPSTPGELLAIDAIELNLIIATISIVG